jgi:predicted glycogen debranching enzyme
MALFTIETYRELKPHDEQEWLLTNGLGGYAMSTGAGMNTRRYHGLLCAATLPPVGRVMTVNRIGEMLTLDDQSEKLLEFSVNAFRGAIHPRGDQYLTKFELDDIARWEYGIEGAKVTKEIQLLWLNNVAAVRYTIDAPNRPFRLSLLPMFSLRDFHALRQAGSTTFRAEAAERRVTVGEGPHVATITTDTGRFEQKADYWYGQVYPIETERGQDDIEDLYTPGRFVLEGRDRGTITLWIGLEPVDPGDWEAERRRRYDAVMAACTEPENIGAGREHGMVTPAMGGRVHPVAASKSLVIQKLFRASNDFVVYRKSPSGEDGTSVIAGYPWFSDWGRDTMISLPGLLLVPGRYRQAREVLTVFAHYVSEGMIPNRFDDYTNEPSYNTVDASLWFIHAVHEYARLSKDSKTFEEVLKPACRQIIDGYRNGTRFHIKMDPSDGLVTQGDIHTQLTWMDAKYEGIAFTPRQGKPVEINALWYHALVLMGERELADKVAESFRRAFWISPFRGLADVLEGTRRDASIRPNQIFAVSLPNSPLTIEQQAAVVEVVRRELLTPVGLRTLSRSDPNYRGRYCGPQSQRDAAYHNGTVWAWPLGAFLEAYLKVNKRSDAAVAQAREWLMPLIQQMTSQGGIGQIAEIFEGDEPHRPVGCPAQAWSVAEVLRLAVELGM